MNTTTESEKNASAPEVPQPKKKRATAKKAKPAKKAGGQRSRLTNPKRIAQTRRPKSSR